jgi:hypothetical protein
LALLPAAALAAAVLGGCAHHGASTGAGPGGGATASQPSPPSASELAHMRKLVDGADAAASAADKDAAADK